MDAKTQVMTLKEAAEYCRVSERTFSTWIKRGVVRSIKTGGRRLLLMDDLLADLRKMQEGAA